MRSFGLLTDKPQVVARQRRPRGSEVPDVAPGDGPRRPRRSTPSSSWSCPSSTPRSAPAFMADLGITEFGRDRIIRKAYDAVGIITFFTAGEPEVRGWNLERGGTAVDAAGKIHTDLAKGFIRAEVTAYDDLARLGTVKEVKAKNLQRLEGKDYVVKDGDVMYFRSGL